MPPRVVARMKALLPLAAAIFLLLACGGPKATVSSAAQTGPSQQSAPAAPRVDVAALALADTVITVTNLEDAKALAQAGDKRILMVFAGSDWCAPCKVFKRSVLTEAAFLEGGKDDYVVVYLDFPSKKRNQLPPEQKAYNDGLAERYNEQGVFPRVYLLDKDGETVREMKFRGQSAEEFVAELEAADG